MTGSAPRARQQQKQKAREKRNNTKCCVRFRGRLFEKHSAMYVCDSEKTLFINIVLRYIAEAGNRYILSLFFFPLFFLLLYIVLNDEFLPARVDFFRNIRLRGSSERFGAWVLLFSRFSCFCGPEKNNIQNQQQRWQMGSCSGCV